MGRIVWLYLYPCAVVNGCSTTNALLGKLLIAQRLSVPVAFLDSKHLSTQNSSAQLLHRHSPVSFQRSLLPTLVTPKLRVVEGMHLPRIGDHHRMRALTAQIVGFVEYTPSVAVMPDAHDL